MRRPFAPNSWLSPVSLSRLPAWPRHAPLLMWAGLFVPVCSRQRRIRFHYLTPRRLSR
jgi:hypothetical protein